MATRPWITTSKGSYKEQVTSYKFQGGMVARFEDLAVWKRSARLSAELYKSLRELKDFGFRDQITRAGLSIPSNIAEGYERESAKETTNFLNYAKGSAGELRTQLYIGMDIGYIEREAGMQWIREAEEISRMLHGLMQTIRTQKT